MYSYVWWFMFHAFSCLSRRLAQWVCASAYKDWNALVLEQSNNSKTARHDRQLAFTSEFHGIIPFIFRNQGSSESRCPIALPHDFWTQANGLYRLTACDKSPNLIIITSLHRLNIRTVFDEALNTVADVLPNTPRIEVAHSTRPARTLAMWMIFKWMRVVFMPSPLLFGVSENRRVISPVINEFRYSQGTGSTSYRTRFNHCKNHHAWTVVEYERCIYDLVLKILVRNLEKNVDSYYELSLKHVSVFTEPQSPRAWLSLNRA